jgi:4'-phosphopantetheinyl transferase
MDQLSLLWSAPPADLSLEAADVHIWRAELDCSTPALAHYQTLLSADEQARADRFKFGGHRQHFIAARGILRTLLSRYLPISPQALQFTYGTHGKPALAPATLQFNLAHSQGLALYAITRDRPVGIDLEQLRPLTDLTALAQRCFAASECAALAQLDPTQQIPAFFRYWTCKEAYLKATGTGLSQLQGLAIALTPNQPARLLTLPHGAAPESWHLQELAPGAGFVGAIVTFGQACYWQFTAPQNS